MRVVFFFWFFFLSLFSVARGDKPISLSVDLSDAPQRIFHAHEVVPAAPGKLELSYPKWIPGEHGPNGPIANLANLRFSVAGKPLAWKRDPIDVYRFSLEVPAGASAVDIDFDYLAPASADGFSSSNTTSSSLAVLEWNVALLYPSDKAARDVLFAPSVKLPAGWKMGSALGPKESWKPVSLETLVDSPVIAGKHLKTIALGKSDEIIIGADNPDALAARPETIDSWRRLVEEAGALFGARHYESYHFLLALSESIGHFGLEHHQSSDNRAPERMLIDDDTRSSWSTLLPHEFVHSWNGKYRRPASLNTPDFGKPMQGDLLWVYEGLTNYLGWVLAARSHLLPKEWATDEVAMMAAILDHRAGRAWRPLADTAVAAQVLYGSAQEWSSLRRGVDFYPEGTLLWLESDVLIRQRSKGARSLDDFCKRFFGGTSGAPSVKPYTLDDVVAALNAVEPYDWRGFFDARVYSVAPHPPMAGIENGGWKLTFDDKPNKQWAAVEKIDKLLLLDTSLGARLKEDGTFLDVTPGMPAAQGGLAPGMKLVGVNGRKWSPTLLHDAIKSNQPIEILAENAEFYVTAHLKHKGGERYPHLERVPAKPDLLEQILQSQAAKVSER